MTTLPVPYISQIDEGRPINDCGPASALMVARAYGKALDTSIDDLYARHGWADVPLAVSTIMNVLDGLFVPCHRETASLARLRALLDEGHPVILLVDYGPVMAAGLHQFSIRGGHFVVATGHGPGYFTVHDPYQTDARGAHVRWPEAVLDAAWRPHGQYNYTAIVPDEPLVGGDEEEAMDIQKARAAIEAAHANLVQALEALTDDAPTPMPSPGPVLEVFNTGGATLRVRETPNGRIIGALMPGQRVRELERRDGWVRHDAGGWSHGDYLRPT